MYAKNDEKTWNKGTKMSREKLKKQERTSPKLKKS